MEEEERGQPPERACLFHQGRRSLCSVALVGLRHSHDARDPTK